MVSQLFGAFVRALLVALLISTPSLILPGVSRGTQEISLVFALIGAAITLFEYGSSHPGLVEFRFAPPFNRIRFISLFLTVLLIAIMSRGYFDKSGLAQIVRALGNVVGQAMDFPFSPVRILTELMTENRDEGQISLIRSAAGISYVVSLLSLAVFGILMRLLSWPLGSGSFNVWINLPTFDPAAGYDVEDRLTRDSRVNIIFGFTLPFLIPMVASLSSGYYDFGALGESQSLIWAVSIWAFLPASLFMRGIAMGKIARLIKSKRNRLNQPSASGLAAA